MKKEQKYHTDCDFADTNVHVVIKALEGHRLNANGGKYLILWRLIFPLFLCFPSFL